MVASALPIRPSEPRYDTVVAADGVSLAVESFGAPQALSVLFSHGFGQSRHAWTETAAALSTEGYHCVTVDSRGHGDSAWAKAADYDFAHFIADVHTLAERYGPRPVWVGASMGGLLGLMAEGESASGVFAALVLVDVTPRWELAGVERILAFMRAHPDGFASVDEAQAAVRAYLPHRASANSPDRLRRYLVPTGDGRLRWHWDPKLLDTVARDSGNWQARLTAAAAKLHLPVLLVSGGKSDVVSAHTIEEFLTLAPHAEHVQLVDATHMVVGDANDRFTDAVADFLRRHVPTARAAAPLSSDAAHDAAHSPAGAIPS
jgi:pimeloyl-ACP methyl ester carboxylesterase